MSCISRCWGKMDPLPSIVIPLEVARNPLPKTKGFPRRLKVSETLIGAGRPRRPLEAPPALFYSRVPRWEFRASARSLKRNKDGWMPAHAVGGKNKPTHQLLVCWAREMCRRKICCPTGGVGAPFLYVTSTRRAARHPKP